MVSAKCSDPGALGLDTGLLGSAQFCGLQMKPKVATDQMAPLPRHRSHFPQSAASSFAYPRRDHRGFYHHKPSHPQGFSGSNSDWPWSPRAPPPQGKQPRSRVGAHLLAWLPGPLRTLTRAVSALGAPYSACSLFPHRPTHLGLILAPPPKATFWAPAAARACSLVHFLTWLPFLSAWRLSLQWKLSSQNSANQMLRRLLSSVRLEK